MMFMLDQHPHYFLPKNLVAGIIIAEAVVYQFMYLFFITEETCRQWYFSRKSDWLWVRFTAPLSWRPDWLNGSSVSCHEYGEGGGGDFQRSSIRNVEQSSCLTPRLMSGAIPPFLHVFIALRYREVFYASFLLVYQDTVHRPRENQS
jgi:hypothetical protein